MEDVGIGGKEVTGAVPVVGVRVQDGESPDAVFFPEVYDAEGHVVEAAVSPEVISSRMVAPGPDEGEGIANFPFGDLLTRHHHSHGGVPCGGAEGVPFYPFYQVRGVDLQDQLLRDRARLIEHHVLARKNIFKDCGIVCQARTHGQVAAPGIGRVVEDAGGVLRHSRVHIILGIGESRGGGWSLKKK